MQRSDTKRIPAAGRRAQCPATVVGIDIGRTFTDLVPAVLQGVEELGLSDAEPALFVQGSTVAINALLERRAHDRAGDHGGLRGYPGNRTAGPAEALRPGAGTARTAGAQEVHEIQMRELTALDKLFQQHLSEQFVVMESCVRMFDGLEKLADEEKTFCEQPVFQNLSTVWKTRAP